MRAGRDGGGQVRWESSEGQSPQWPEEGRTLLKPRPLSWPTAQRLGRTEEEEEELEETATGGKAGRALGHKVYPGAAFRAAR